jgi:Mg2+ and Co2+ transporter CorA
LASHLIDARGTVEPNIDPEGVESRLRDRVFLWLDIDSTTEADFQLLHDAFDLHPLALEHARKFGQRPKIEDFDDFTLLVVFGAVDDPARRAGLAPIEVHCFYSPHWLITVHKGECPVFAELRNQTHRRLQRYRRPDELDICRYRHILRLMARSSTTSDVFNAIAESRRREILDLLIAGEKPVGGIVDELSMSQPQVSKHLRVLSEVGLVRCRAEGRRRLYSLEPTTLQPFQEWLAKYEEAMNDRLDRMDDYLKDLQQQGEPL